MRRWLKQANPGLAALLTEKLGSAWENDLEDLERLKWAADDAEFRQRFRAIKRANKERLANTIHQLLGVDSRRSTRCSTCRSSASTSTSASC